MVCSDGELKRAVGVEDLDAVVDGHVGHSNTVGHGNAAVGNDSDVGRIVELAVGGAAQPEGKRERAVGVEDLHAVVAGVEYRNPAIGADVNAGRVVELPVAVAVRSDDAVERAVGVEDLHAVVAGIRSSTVGHHNTPVGAEGDVGQGVELSATIAARPEGKRERAVGVEDLDAVVAAVGHRDAPVGADVNAGRVVALPIVAGPVATAYMEGCGGVVV